MIIDVHAHALHEGFLEGLCRRPACGLAAERDGKGGYIVQRKGDRAGYPGSLDTHLHDMASRLESLRRRGVTKQLVGPPPGFLCWPGGATDVDGARAMNDQIAAVVADGEGLLGGMATVALGEPERAAEELERAVDKHGFQGTMIPTTAGGIPLDLPQFEPVIEAFERLGLLVFMHPARVDYPEHLAKFRAYTLIRFPYETAFAATRFIFTGLLERHPRFNLILSHGGGNLPYLRGRLDTAYDATGWEADPSTHEHISHRPSHYFQQLYYDTCVLSADSLRFLIPLVGVHRVMFGSDYPFEIGDPEGCHAMPAIDELSREDRMQVMGGNANAVLQGVAVKVRAAGP
jgi:aminocarboxymuconate-semialdehyde decarboxylase